MNNNKTLYIPTEIEKENMIEHIKYEINMFSLCYLTLNIFREKGLFRNVFIESFLIHARNLYIFFYSDDYRDDDDIIARDYVIDFKKYIKERTDQNKFKDIKIKWNKLLTHLSCSRLKYIDENKDWYISILFQLIDTTKIAFLNSISKNQKEWFR